MEAVPVEERRSLVERLSGDKVVWIIYLSLCMFSLVSIFSSTSGMVTASKSRIDILLGQIFTIVLGMVCIWVCYRIRKVKIFKFLSMFGFILCLGMLSLLASHTDLGIIKPRTINGAWRVLVVGGLQIHVFEVAKIAMIMYLAWAVDTFHKDRFTLIKRLAHTHEKLAFLETPIWQEIFYIYLPMLIVTFLILLGSTSSAVFTLGMMLITILIGGIDIKHVTALGLIGAGLLAGCLGLHMATRHSDHVLFKRMSVFVTRLHLDKSGEDGDNMGDMEKFLTAKEGSREFYDALDLIRQPRGARLAIHEGGLFGKGAGQSTQKYIVPVMYEDYMFSFIVEEYGMLFGLILMMLYVSLLARGSIIARNCDNNFARIAIAGLCLLISVQGLFHIFINMDFGLLTGQTLPLVSHGTSSFVCFSIAFGVILSISRMATDNIRKETDKAGPLMEEIQGPADEVSDNLNDLDAFESGQEFTDNDIL